MSQPYPPTRPQWVVQVLTLDYLIDGYTEAGGAAELLLQTLTVRPPDLVLWLASARVQAASTLAVPLQQGVRCAIPFHAELVATIPRDAGSTQYAQTQLQQLPVYPVAAAVYVGPYVLRGTVLSQARDAADLGRAPAFGMQDVTIDHLAPGAALHELRVPYAMVYSRMLQAIVPTG